MLEDLKLQMLKGPTLDRKTELPWQLHSSKFFHLYPGDLRVADIEALQKEYAALFVPI
jgi:hypothetical protein